MAPKKSTLKKDTRFVKAATKQTKKQSTQIKRTATTLKKAITKLNKVFSTPKKAVKNVLQKKSSKKSSTTKKTAKTKQPQKVGSVRKAKTGTSSRSKLLKILDPKNYPTWNAWAEDVLKHADEINTLIDPSKGEYFVARYFGGQTFDAYENIEFLIAKLNSYEASKLLGSDTGPRGQDLLHSVKVIQIKGGATKYFDANKARIQERAKQKMEIEATAREVLGEDAARVRPRSRIDLLRDLTTVTKTERARADAAEARVSALEKKLNDFINKVTGPSKKKSKKKSTKKAKVSNVTKKGKSKPKSGSTSRFSSPSVSTPKRSTKKDGVSRSSSKKSRTSIQSTKTVVKKASKKNASPKRTNNSRTSQAGGTKAKASKPSSKASAGKKASKRPTLHSKPISKGTAKVAPKKQSKKRGKK
jgi:hypothetical protein